MRFLIKLFIISFICVIAMFGALASENQSPGLIVALVVWVWFIYSVSRPRESRTERRIREQERRIEELLRRLEQKGH
ncbi:MAG: hypothetical protein JJU34_18365 [Lunatimonas sp.]|uniref:hypothetical protein n=1 Tax=Lunatimonas sp. TaxID=2060141 RepID=UPI00263BB9B4|nr:hypothetical protein [Lunatimonas sp.]MCC5939250.1 hypothetical protein [Lunatimonas sp.]